MTAREHGRRRGRRAEPGARRVAWRALAAFAQGPATVRIADEIARADLDGRELALAREIASGAVRRQRLLDHLLLGLAPRGLPADPDTLAALRLGAYQVLFLERVPVHAAVDETVRLVHPRVRGFVNAVLRRLAAGVLPHAAPDGARDVVPLGPARSVQSARPLPDPETDPDAYLGTVHGLPDFLVARWRERLGRETAERLAAAAGTPPAVHLRAVGCTAEELAARLLEEGTTTEPSDHPRALRWTGGRSPFRSRAFLEGACLAQDPTAIRAAEALGAAPGERILDLCAAPGTKATLIAEAVGPTGRVFAHDVDAVRRRRIAENAERLRLPWLEIVSDPAAGAPFDAVLVDAPCSNTGVLARRPEIRHRLTPEALPRLAETQTALLRQGLALVRPGGRVVYATCSIEPEENAAVVRAAGSGATVRIEHTALPDPPRHDGGYHAVLEVDASRA